FFRHAVKHRLIDANPFVELAGTTKGNAKRFYFVSREDAQKVLNACPDLQWRLIFALARFGGLRCPSEIVGLTWGDINWEQERITVRSPKTEHHEGGECRVAPIFPELRPLLEEAFEAAEPGAVRVVSKHLDSNSNLRTTMEKIIKRAGLKPWPKLFQNLRSTRQTELAEEFPAHVVCEWIGNSQAVAAEHYLQTTEEHFARAARTTHKTTHGTAEMSGNERNGEGQECEKPLETVGIQGFSHDDLYAREDSNL
ncbi:MAG: site-specific integrase, partial [Planctomycetes bacterium]|nr:site-specific integrase [Planctomycetota bacterium]